MKVDEVAWLMSYLQNSLHRDERAEDARMREGFFMSLTGAGGAAQRVKLTSVPMSEFPKDRPAARPCLDCGHAVSCAGTPLDTQTNVCTFYKTAVLDPMLSINSAD